MSSDPNCDVCDGAGWDWRRAADEDLQVDDPVDYYQCPCVEVMRLRSWIDRQEPRKVYEATVCPICHRATESYYMRPVEDHATGCPWREASREQ